MKFILSALLFSAAATLCAQSTTTAAAQIQKLQADANVVWMGEIYRDFTDLDGTYEGRVQDRTKPVEMGGLTLYSHQQYTEIVKLLRPNTGMAISNWSTGFFDYVFDENAESFADADLTKKLSAKDKKALCTSRDSIVVFNSETFKEEVAVVDNTLDPKSVVSYRLREVVYYDKKNEQYQVLPIALAPIVLQYNDVGTCIGHKLLFWLPINQLAAPINTAATPNMPYIRSVYMHTPLGEAKELKATQTWAKCNDGMLEKLRKEKDKALVLDIMQGDSEKSAPMTAKEIGYLGASIDTIITFDQTTFKEIVTVVTNNAQGKDIAAIRVHHVFAWDEKKRQLSMHIYSFAPIINRYDDKGKFLNSGPMFYLLPHKRYRTVSK